MGQVSRGLSSVALMSDSARVLLGKMRFVQRGIQTLRRWFRPRAEWLLLVAAENAASAARVAADSRGTVDRLMNFAKIVVGEVALSSGKC